MYLVDINNKYFSPKRNPKILHIVSFICPIFIRDGRLNGFKNRSNILPLSRKGISVIDTSRVKIPLLP